MIYMNERISLRLADQILRQARKRTNELIKDRNNTGKNYSISQYLRELIQKDYQSKILD